MKKNMLTIVVIALCLVNLALNVFIMLSVVPASNEANKLVSDIASIVNLELEGNTTKNKVSMSDMDVVTFENSIQINLKSSGDGKDHYAIIDSISIYLIKTADDYEKLSANMKQEDLKSGYESTVDEIVNDHFIQHTKEEAQNNKEAIKMAILKDIQEKFGTQTIADIAFKNLRFQ